MPKFTKCSFFGCDSNVVNNKELSFFKYPISDNQRFDSFIRILILNIL
jgi:hypothetical protein